jgi:hypothetical protein
MLVPILCNRLMHTKPCTLDQGCAQIHALYNILLLCKLQDVVRDRAHFALVSILGCAFTVIKFILDVYCALFLRLPNQQSCCRPDAESLQSNVDLPICPLFTSPHLEMDVRILNIEKQCLDSKHY